MNFGESTQIYVNTSDIIGAPGTIRTCDLRLRRLNRQNSKSPILLTKFSNSKSLRDFCL